ncbi:MAG: hypothetical protein GVY36_05610 [Verrucomicrobia bacterium]|jgi:hypothetical protein|nr:hypothetical protein [Verrucomicrobiota bacterium]
MKFLDSLEKRFGFLAVPNVMMTLIMAQLLIYAAILSGRVEFTSVVLGARAVLGGEWWRLITFIIAPPYLATSLFQALFLAFFWYIMWMMSQALESVWSVFKFNVFLLLGIVLSIAGALIGQLISPGAAIGITSYVMGLSIFFAFATYNPNIEFMLFLVIPVKVKWLAWFTAGMTTLSFLFAPTMGHRLVILAPLLNYLLFCRGELLHSVKSGQRRAQFAAKRKAEESEARHTCSQCGATEQSHPDRDFRYKVVDGDAICLCDECRDERP